MSFSRVQSLMAENGLDAALIADNANIFYLARSVFRGYIYLSLDREPLYLIIKPLDLKGDRWHFIRKPEMIPEVLAECGLPLPRKIGLELDDIAYSQVMRLKGIFPGAEIQNVSSVMRLARMVKDEDELALLREDGRKHVAVYSRIPSLYKPGMSDIELQIEIERVLRMEGCLGYLRTSGNLMEINMGSVLNGDNADVPTPYDFAVGGGGVDVSLPVGADGRIMKNGTSVMIDMNGNFNGYQTDLTRTWAIESVTDEVLEIHNQSIAICRMIEREALPGVPVKVLYEKAEKMVKDAGLENIFMGHRQHAQFIGHGVGIQLNEWPVIMRKSPHIIEKNMVIAVEPKFVIPKVGAVGIENTYIVGESGLENITPAPEEMAVLTL